MANTGDPKLQRGEKGIVSDHRILAITPHAVASSDRDLFKGKEVFVGELHRGASQHLGAQRFELLDPLRLAEPGEEAAC